MERRVKCSRCGTSQTLGDKCVNCGLDFGEYARILRERRAPQARGGQEKPARTVKCPRCKAPQPLSEKCIKCGLDFRQYARRLKAKKAEREKAAAATTRAETPRREAPERPAPTADEEQKPAAKTARPGATGLSGIDAMFERTWNIYKKRVFTLVGLYLLGIVFLVVPVLIAAFLGGLLSGMLPGPEGLFPVVFIVIGAVIGTIASIWAFAAMIAAVCNDTLGVTEALSAANLRLWSFIWVVSVVGYIVVGGFFLFFVPGILLMTWFFAAQYIIFDEDVRGMDAALKSMAYTGGMWWGVFGRLVLIALVGQVVGMVPVLGPILFTPFMFIYIYIIYHDLREIKGDEVAFDNSSGEKAKWILLGTAGYALPVLLVLLLGGMSLFTVMKSIPLLMQ